MQAFSPLGFGEVIAFLLPGLVALRAVAHFSDSVGGWFTACESSSAPVGPALLLLIGGLAAGVTVSAVRWAGLDCFLFRKHQLCDLDYSKVDDHKEAFRAIIEGRYRFYQFNGNMLVAVVALVTARFAASGSAALAGAPLALTITLVLAILVLLLASRDGIRRTRQDLVSILGRRGGATGP
jgi:hypothetical protein